MRSFVILVLISSVFAGVFFYRRATVKPPTPRAPVPGAREDAEKFAALPGNPVTIRLVRSALEIEGDAADPIQDVQLFRLGNPEQKVEFTGGTQSPVHVSWNFELDPKATYRAEVKTKHRSTKCELHPADATPAEAPNN
jgi:hypothetical protein